MSSESSAVSSALPSRRRTWATAAAQRPLVIAHRGASGHSTENTLPAFQRAMADGADGIELDVQRCKTGEMVVFHDESLRRLAGRRERIDELSLAALREVRLLPGGEIPTLAEAIEACGPLGLVNIEIKDSRMFPVECAALVAGVADVVARATAGSRVLVSSFSPGIVWLWRRRFPDVPCGLLFERPRPFCRPWPLRTDLVLPWLRPGAVHPEDSLCTRERVTSWRQHGYAVNVWTVDDSRRMQALAALGVCSIITNDPRKALAVLRANPG